MKYTEVNWVWQEEFNPAMLRKYVFPGIQVVAINALHSFEVIYPTPQVVASVQHLRRNQNHSTGFPEYQEWVRNNVSNYVEPKTSRAMKILASRS